MSKVNEQVIKSRCFVESADMRLERAGSIRLRVGLPKIDPQMHQKTVLNPARFRSPLFHKENDLEIKVLQTSQKKAPAAAFCRTRSSEEVKHIILPIINMNIFVVL